MVAKLFRSASLLSLTLAAPVIAATTLPATASAQSETRAITDLGDGLYRWTAGNYHSFFLVHDEGIVTGDPLSKEAAHWLRGELRKRFPDKPITHVLYSHNHPDHAYGGEELDDGGTQFIAHELAAQDWVMTKARVRMPDITFADSFTLALSGGDHVVLQYWGTNNGRGSVSMLMPEHDTLHVVDWITLGRLPYLDLKGYDLIGAIASTRAVLDNVQFSKFIGGHADMGTPEDVRRYLSYLETLHAGVLDGIIAGKSLEEIQSSLDLSAFSDLKMFVEWRDDNIAGAYRQLVDDEYLQMRPEVPKPE